MYWAIPCSSWCCVPHFFLLYTSTWVIENTVLVVFMQQHVITFIWQAEFQSGHIQLWRSNSDIFDRFLGSAFHVLLILFFKYDHLCAFSGQVWVNCSTSRVLWIYSHGIRQRVKVRICVKYYNLYLFLIAYY